MKYDYLIDADFAALKVNLSINDVVLFQSSKGRPEQFNSMLNQWLKKGDNVCSVILDKVVKTGKEKPEEAAYLDKDENKKAKISIKSSEGGKELWSYIFSASDVVELQFPYTNAKTQEHFSVVDEIPVWAWEGGPGIKRVADVEPRLFDSFKIIYDAFFAADVPRLVELSKIRNREMAASFHMAENDHVAEVKKSFQRVFSGKSPKQIDLRGPDDLLFEPAWHGHLFKVTTLDGRQPLSTLRDNYGLVIGYDVYLGWVNGDWVWVR